MSRNINDMRAEAQTNVDAHPNLCGCGTCAEAYQTAVKMVKQNAEYQCPMWMLQVAHAMIGLSKMDMFDKIREDNVDPMIAYVTVETHNNEVQKVMNGHCLLGSETRPSKPH